MDEPTLSLSPIAFIGLGAMGGGMASVLVEKGFKVHGYDVYPPSLENFQKVGGIPFHSPSEAAKDAKVLIIMVTNFEQVNDVLFGADGAIQTLSNNCIVIVCSTVPPKSIRNLNEILKKNKNIQLLDAPVSGGVLKAKTGKLTIMASASEEVLKIAHPILSAMSENLYIVSNEVGDGSAVKMINQLLAGVHIAVSAEAMAFCAKNNLNTRFVYDVIKNAAGNSWMFENRVPHMLDNDFTPKSALDIFVKDLGIVLEEGKHLKFPLPITSIAHQQFLLGSSAGFGREDDSAIVKIWEQMCTVSVKSEKINYKNSLESNSMLKNGHSPSNFSGCAPNNEADFPKVAFFGLGAMGFGIAKNLLQKKFKVYAYDIYKPAMEKFKLIGGEIFPSPSEAAKNASICIIVVTNSSQAEDVIFGKNGICEGLSKNSIIILCSTVPPEFSKTIEKKLMDIFGIFLLDCPLSGGVLKAENGDLTIMASGNFEAIKKSELVLTSMSEKLYIVNEQAGSASAVKMINQLLAGVHIAVSAEAMAFCAKNNLNTRFVYDVIKNAAGNSWMFENRVPHMLDNDFTPKSALDIFVKDLGIVLEQAKLLKFPLPIASIAHQLFLAGASASFGREDDSALVKIYEKVSKISTVCPTLKFDPSISAGQISPISKKDALDSLPAELADDGSDSNDQTQTESNQDISDFSLIVLDDDPTGTQTVHGVTVVTQWGVDLLKEELTKTKNCLFILTNSRSLPSNEASDLIKEICLNLQKVIKNIKNIKFTIVLRGDSTLRGHFPEEPDAVSEIFGDFDTWIICPFFLQGGRYTINDIHYVAEEDLLVPAGMTEFAKDYSFGYSSSNLKQWVEEKTKGRIKSSDVASVSIDLIRQKGSNGVCDYLLSLSKGAVCIVNAASENDLKIFSSGMRKAEIKGKQFLCRTAASFVSCFLNTRPKPVLLPVDLKISKSFVNGRRGGLIVVGSYVPKTTKQLNYLMENFGNSIKYLTVEVSKILSDDDRIRQNEIIKAIEVAESAIKSNTDVLIMTSRKLITGNDSASSLEINSKISMALVEIISKISIRPRYILAKGGITSSDTVSKALKCVRADVAGQAHAGVPLWQLGNESHFPNIPYIVFPGNVGSVSALYDVIHAWSKIKNVSTKEILLDAYEKKYAICAFNIYNIEGLNAVVDAAEEENSPAIIQIHPASLKNGGKSFVHACIYAASNSKVPISVHFDHGNDENDLNDAISLGFNSIMIDGSSLDFDKNVQFTKIFTKMSKMKSLTVEAELGRLTGKEDDLTVEKYEEKLTNIEEAKLFLEETNVDFLAVCVGNVHGNYPSSGPKIDFHRLQELCEMAKEYGTLIVMHGASGLPEPMIQKCIDLGVVKFNVNTEVRNACVEILKEFSHGDLIDAMKSTYEAMKIVMKSKLRLLQSSGKAI